MSDKLLLPIGAGIYPAPKWDFFNTPLSLRNRGVEFYGLTQPEGCGYQFKTQL